MESILPKKYNNKIVIGLAVALVVAVGVAIYYYMNSGNKEPFKNDHHQSSEGSIKPTKLDVQNPALVLFWAGWCGHSTAMKPAWDKIAQILANDGTVDVYEFEAEKDKNLITAAQSKLRNFEGFPDIRFFPQGFDLDKPCIKHRGQRSEEEILAFAYGNLNK